MHIGACTCQGGRAGAVIRRGAGIHCRQISTTATAINTFAMRDDLRDLESRWEVAFGRIRAALDEQTRDGLARIPRS